MWGTKFVLEVVKRLQKKVDIEIFIQNWDPKIIKKFTDEWIKVNNFRSLSTNSKLFWFFLPYICIKNANTLQNELKRWRFDTVVTNMFPMNYIATKLKWFNIYQYCYEPFAFFWDKEMLKWYGFMFRFILKILKLLYGKLDIYWTKYGKKVFTLVPEISDSIRNIYGINSIVTYLWIDTDFFSKKDWSLIPVVIKNIVKAKKILLHSNDFTPIKRLDFVLQIMKEIKKKRNDIVCLITTSIPDKNKLKQLQEKIEKMWIDDVIIVLGFVDYNLLPQYYSISDLWLYTWTSQGCWTSAASLTVLEWMACWLPFLRTNDTDHEVLDKINWFLLDPYDLQKWADTILTNIDNHQLLQDFSKNASNHIITKYNRDSVADIIFTNLH